MKDKKNTGLEVKAPSRACEDRKCPFHGEINVKGRIFVGTVVSSLARHTVNVMWERKHYLPKFERYETRRTKIHAHNPPCIDAKEDDKVKIAECRPLSKTKNFVIIEKLGKNVKIEAESGESEEKQKQESSKADEKTESPKESQKKQSNKGK